ncbi:DUF1758 domain-containing protein [Trichonephila clavipes]|nr:DUF1758 domain-containing protein [Trichonephila clavipes]
MVRLGHPSLPPTDLGRLDDEEASPGNVKDAELTAIDEDLHLLEVRLESLERMEKKFCELSHKSKTVPTFQEFIEFLEQRESVLLSVSVDRNAKVNPNKMYANNSKPKAFMGLGIRDDLVLHETDQAIEIFKETVEFEKGRYIVQLSFRKSYNELSDNYPLAKQRFQNLWRRFGHDSELYQQYREIIRDYTEQGIIEEVKTPKLQITN